MNDIITANPTAAGELARRRRHGELPLVAPKVILDTPIWLHPRKAAGLSHYVQRYTNLLGGTPIPCTVEVANSLPMDGRASSGGVLRHTDLDVLMALSLAWTNAGCPSGPTATVEVEQRDMLRWLGFDNLTKAPYQELRACLERLEFTTVAVWSGSETPPPGTRPFRLLEGQTVREDVHAQGKPKVLNVRLSDVWREALASIHDWQAVDVHAYAHLVRTHRRLGLARVLYLYLMCSREKDESFSIPYTMIRDRFAQRKSNGSLVYANPMDERGTLGRALKALHTSGVVQFKEQPNKPLHELRLEGVFQRQSAPRLEPKQTYFLSPGLWDDKPRLVDDQQPGAPDVPQQEETPPEAKEDEKEGNYRLLFDWMKARLRAVVQAQLIEEARAAGAKWSHLACVLLVADANGVAKTSGFLATILRNIKADPAILELWTISRAHEQIGDWNKSDFISFAKQRWAACERDSSAS